MDEDQQPPHHEIFHFNESGQSLHQPFAVTIVADNVSTSSDSATSQILSLEKDEQTKTVTLDLRGYTGKLIFNVTLPEPEEHRRTATIADVENALTDHNVHSSDSDDLQQQPQLSQEYSSPTSQPIADAAPSPGLPSLASIQEDCALPPFSLVSPPTYNTDELVLYDDAEKFGDDVRRDARQDFDEQSDSSLRPPASDEDEAVVVPIDDADANDSVPVQSDYKYGTVVSSFKDKLTAMRAKEESGGSSSDYRQTLAKTPTLANIAEDASVDTAPTSNSDSKPSALKSLRGKAAFKELAKKVITENSFTTRSRASSTSGDETIDTASTSLDPGMSMPSAIGGTWGKMLMVASMKQHMPNKVRAHRNALRPDVDSSSIGNSALDNANNQAPATPLHALCALSDVSLLELQKCMENNPGAVRVQDVFGRLPLHILGDNDSLLGTMAGRQVATTFGWSLMQTHPEGLTTRDVKGHYPFVSLIVDWVIWTYANHRKNKIISKAQTNNQPMMGTPFQFINANKGKDGSSHGTVSEITTVRNIATSNANMNLSNPEIEDLQTASVYDNMASVMNYSSRAFPTVELWAEAEWCLAMMSLAMDELGGKNGGLHQARARALVHHRVKDKSAREQLARHLVTNIPTLIKTILLIDDENGAVRKRLMKMSIVRRILLSPESVGTWVTSTLRRNGIPSTRGVDYLEYISQTCVEDYIGHFTSPSQGEIDGYYDERERVFEKIGTLEGTIASLVTLDARETERAASTQVVWHLMSKNLGRPFVVGLVLIDFVLHITLMMAFRNDVQFHGRGKESAVGDVPTQVVIFICSHYFLRKVCEALSLWNIHPKVFKSYFGNVWTLFDFVAIVLTLAAIIWNDNHPKKYREGFNAFVLGLLWIKVLGFLKVVNKEMSTFILALIQILADMRYFMVVLCVIVFMFGDMMHISLSTKEHGLFCILNEEDLGGPSTDFCSKNVYQSYLRVYSLLLGDFELDDYLESDGITALFVLFTLLGVVILLNVLIAIISDSYEKAKIQSLTLFGSARVTFIAQNEALESFLRPGTNPLEAVNLIKEGSTTRLRILTFVGRLGRWFVLLAIIATAFDAEVYLVTRAIVLSRTGSRIFTLICLFALCIVLTMALWVVLTFAFDGMIRNHLPDRVIKGFDFTSKYTRYGVNAIASRLFGLEESKRVANRSDSDDDEWTGRMTYLERKFDKSIQTARDELSDELKDMEKRLYDRNLAFDDTGSSLSGQLAEKIAPSL